MDAEKDFNTKEWNKDCIHMRRNMPLNSISLNWTSKNTRQSKARLWWQHGKVDFSSMSSTKTLNLRSKIKRKSGKQKKLIAAIVSSRETGHRRRDEGKTMSSQIHKTTQGNQGSDRCTSEGGGRQKLKQDDGDFPACMRRENNNRENKTRRNGDLKGEGGGRLKHCNVDGDVPLCLRSFDEENKDSSSIKIEQQRKDGERKQRFEQHEEWQQKQNDKRKQMFVRQYYFKEKPRKWKSKNQSHHFHRVTEKHEINAFTWKNRVNGMRARRVQIGCNITERNVEARQVIKIWRKTKTQIHGCRKIWQQTRSWNYAQQEVASKKYRLRIHQRKGHHCHDRGKPPTHQIDECLLLSLGICGPPRWKNVQNNREDDKQHKNAYRLLGEISMLSRDQDAELTVQVLENTHSTEETREVIGWHIDWCYTILQHSTRCIGRILGNKRPTDHQKELRSGIDYIIIKRRHLKYKDAEAKYMIRMGSDHRCVTATFMITTPKKDGHRKKKKQVRDNKTRQGWEARARKRYQDIIEQIREKADAANKELSQSKEKPSKQKKQQHKKKGRKKRKQQNQMEGDGKISRWITSWTSHTSERGGMFYRATCRTRHGRKKEDRNLEWRGLPWRRGHNGAQARRNEWKADWERHRNRLSEHCTRNCMSVTTWKRKERQNEWSRLLRGWDHDGISSKKKQMKQQQQKHLNPVRRSQRKT